MVMSEKEPRKTNLIIEPSRQVHLDSDVPGSNQGIVRNLLISRQGFPESIDFHSLKDLKNTEAIEVLVKKVDGSTEVLPLPKNVLDAVAEYVRRRSRNETADLDCAGFVSIVKGLPPLERDASGELKESKLDRWEVDKQIGPIAPGEVFFFSNADENGTHFLHAAVYVGYGLFLSVYGLGSDLEASTMDDMKAYFKATIVTKMKPVSAP